MFLYITKKIIFTSKQQENKRFFLFVVIVFVETFQSDFFASEIVVPLAHASGDDLRVTRLGQELEQDRSGFRRGVVVDDVLGDVPPYLVGSVVTVLGELAAQEGVVGTGRIEAIVIGEVELIAQVAETRVQSLIKQGGVDELFVARTKKTGQSAREWLVGGPLVGRLHAFFGCGPVFVFVEGEIVRQDFGEFFEDSGGFEDPDGALLNAVGFGLVVGRRKTRNRRRNT